MIRIKLDLAREVERLEKGFDEAEAFTAVKTNLRRTAAAAVVVSAT